MIDTEVVVETAKKRRCGEGLFDLHGLADHWGIEDLEELKRIIRAQGVPYFSLGKPSGDKVRWDRVRFRIDAVRRWEEEHQCAYEERKAEPATAAAVKPKSLLRCKKR